MRDSAVKLTPVLKERLTDLTELIVSRCVSQPDAVNISVDQRGETLKIELDRRDKARMIGRAGQTINALEEVLNLGMQMIASAQSERELPVTPVIEIRSTERADH
jgi:predicted RNA-binding protein YlqC (UPF0109 family)